MKPEDIRFSGQLRIAIDRIVMLNAAASNRGVHITGPELRTLLDDVCSIAFTEGAMHGAEVTKQIYTGRMPRTLEDIRREMEDGKGKS